MLDDINKVHPLANLNEISFGHLHCVTEVCSHLEHHSITTSDNFAGTKLISLNFFSNYDPGAYYVLLNVNPSVGDSALHAISMHVLKQWTKIVLSSETVAIITGKSTLIGNVQKIDIEEAIALESSVRLLQQLLGPIQFTIACGCCTYSRVHINSSCCQAQTVSNKNSQQKIN